MPVVAEEITALLILAVNLQDRPQLLGVQVIGLVKTTGEKCVFSTLFFLREVLLDKQKLIQ